MGFLNIFEKFKKKELSAENYLSLIITPDRVLSLIWTFDNDEVKPLGFGKKNIQELENITHETAIAIDIAGKSAKSDVSKTVFGLSSYWFEEEHLKEQTLKILKELSTDLELDSEAFVSLASSISHLLKIEESANPNAVLIGVFPSTNQELAFCEFHLVENNKIISTNKYKGTANPEKIKQLIGRLKQEDKDLPSRVVLFGTSEEFVHKMQKLAWQDLFIHEPKINFMDDEKLAKSVAFTQARDILGHEPALEGISQEPSKKEKEKKAASEFGFVEDEDILLASHLEDPVKEVIDDQKEPQKTSEKEEEYAVEKEEVQNVLVPVQEEEQEQPKPRQYDKPLALPKFPGIPDIFKHSRILGIALVVVVAFVILGTFVAGQILTQAEVIVKVNSKNEEHTFKADVVTKIVNSDSQIQGQETVGSASGSQKAVATGSKKIGEYAQGEITVLNWTKDPKTFSQDTAVITKNGIKFTLDSDVEVASRSASTPGQNNVSVRAAEFGSNGNIEGGNDFTFQSFDELLYSARNTQAFSGGNEKQITTVADSDLTKLEKSLTDSLLEKAKNNLQEKISGKKFHDSTQVVKITQKNFDKNADEEASLINLDMTIEVSTIVYDQEDLKKYLAASVNKNISAQQEARAEGINVIDANTTRKNDTLQLSGKFQANLVPKLNEDELKSKIASKSTKEARAIIKSLPDIADVQINFQPNIPFVDTLPQDKSKIRFKLETS